MPEMTAEQVAEQEVAPPPIARHHQHASRMWRKTPVRQPAGFRNSYRMQPCFPLGVRRCEANL
jgi:hypothetical protein